MIYPLQALHHHDKTRSCIHDERHAEFELEAFDSTYPPDAQEITVVDCLGRRVNILIDDRIVFQHAELATNEPIPEDLACLNEYKYIPARARWPFGKSEKR